MVAVSLGIQKPARGCKCIPATPERAATAKMRKKLRPHGQHLNMSLVPLIAGAARRRGGWASINRNAGRTGDDVWHRHRRPTHRCRGCSEECLGKARPDSPPCNERVGTGSDRRRTCRKNHSAELAQPHCDFETASAVGEFENLFRQNLRGK